MDRDRPEIGVTGEIVVVMVDVVVVVTVVVVVVVVVVVDVVVDVVVLFVVRTPCGSSEEFTETPERGLTWNATDLTTSAV